MTTLVLLVLAPPAWAELSGEPDNTPQTDGVVFSVLPVGNRIYLGGDFTHVDGLPRNRLAAIDATTGELTDWNPDANSKVLALASSPDGSRIYAGGSFDTIGGLTRTRLAAIDTITGAVDAGFSTRIDKSVRAMAVSGNRLYLGGDFTAVQGQSRANLALVDGTTGALDASWNPAADGSVRALASSPDGGRLYAAGEFTSVSGQPRLRLAALDPANAGAPLPWKPLVNPNGRVFDLAVSGTRVYAAAGGVGGAAESWDAATGARAWQLRGDGDGQAIAVMGTKVYVGGHFVNFAGQRRPFFAAADAATGALDSQWAPSGGGGKLSEVPSTGVWDLSPDESRGRLYAGTNFATVNGQPHAGFVQFSFSTAAADTVPPETSIDSGPTGPVNSTSSSFGFSSTEAGSTFECSLDGTGYAPCTSPKTYTSLLDGPHTFRVRATDPAGNADPTPASRGWTVDTVAPDAPVIVNPPENATTAASFALSGTAEAGSTVEVFDGALSVGTAQADASGAWSKALSNVSDGSHTYTARATDAAGNTSGVSNPLSVSVDATIPDTTITSGPSGTVNSREATFAFSSTEPGSAFGCSLDGGPYTACTSPRTYTGLSNGSHTFRVRATDASGNTDPTPASRTWKVQLNGKTR